MHSIFIMSSKLRAERIFSLPPGGLYGAGKFAAIVSFQAGGLVSHVDWNAGRSERDKEIHFTN